MATSIGKLVELMLDRAFENLMQKDANVYKAKEAVTFHVSGKSYALKKGQTLIHRDWEGVIEVELESPPCWVIFPADKITTVEIFSNREK